MFFYFPKIWRQVSLLFLVPAFLSAEPFLADYEEAGQILLRLWDQNYQTELRPTNILANPEKKGILCSKAGKKQVCYYHFRLSLVRPFRQTKNKQDKGARQDNMMILKPGKNVEAWLQCQIKSNAKKLCQWKLYFLRRDLLPGKRKYWHKI